MKIAIVGSGITGLGAAWLLAPHHDITLYEQDDRIGGHANTLSLDGHPPVDTGFVVFNPATYPNFCALLDTLNVAHQASDMSFSVSLNRRAYEYGSDGARGFFAQKRNWLNPFHWQMLLDMQRFFKEAPAYLHNPNPNETLGQYLKRNRYSRAFIDNHLTPMAAAIWSSKAHKILSFPAQSFIQFYANHGLLVPDLAARPQWRTVTGGSTEYVKAISASFSHNIRRNERVRQIVRDVTGVAITTIYNQTDHYDHVILACHADVALKLLHDADDLERGTLGAFSYNDNIAVLHSDDHFMPRRRAAWASWNYHRHDVSGLGVTYWLNRLHALPNKKNYFVTLNPVIEPFGLLAKIPYRHPQFTVPALRAQEKLHLLQGRRSCWFAGAYAGYGFHEDGLSAGLAVAELLSGIKRPWTITEKSSAYRHITGLEK